jgi:hypothetical protein
VPSDEGYEESKQSAVTHLNYINFANARKRKQGKNVGCRFLFV